MTTKTIIVPTSTVGTDGYNDHQQENDDHNHFVESYQIWDLPDVLLYHIVKFIAPPTHRVHVICHQLAPLCHEAYQRLIQQQEQIQIQRTTSDHDDKSFISPSGGNSSSTNKFRSSSSTCSNNDTIENTTVVSCCTRLIWDMILSEEYGGGSTAATTTTTTTRSTRNTMSHGHSGRYNSDPSHTPLSRSSKRLKLDPIQRIQKAHQLLMDNTEIAFFYLNSLVTCSSGSSNKEHHHHHHNNKKKGKGLSLQTMKQILHEYGPNLRVNQVLSFGGTFLVDICRAKNVTQSILFNCVRELMDHHGALPNIRTNESKTSQQTALCVAAVRGMNSVVKYLLRNHHADPTILCSGRFMIHHSTTSTTSRRKTLTCQNVTALQFTLAMRDAEIQNGATSESLRSINECIRLLESASIK